MVVSHVRTVASLNVGDEDARNEVIFPPVLHWNRFPILVLGRHDVEGVQHRSAIDEERSGGEMASGADPERKPVSSLQD